MIENDAVMTVPRIEDVERQARNTGRSVKDVAEEMLKARRRVMEMRRDDPYRFGYEPDIWIVARAMMGLQRVPDVVLRSLAERTGIDHAKVWKTWSDGLCGAMGLKSPVMEMMLLGANSSGKTDFAAKAVDEVSLDGHAKKIMVGSQKWEKSVEVQQARVWHYLPKEGRRTVVSDRAYVRYKEKNGFTGNSFINDEGCRVGFSFYTQQRDDVFEGGKENFLWFDEEYPLEWVETGRYRVARVMGKMLKTFTPISGYTPAVGDDLDGMRVLRWSNGYMLPRDAGMSCPWHALGLSEEELGELERWSTEAKRGGISKARPQTVPCARAEDCSGWWKGVDECDGNLAPDRVWERVPRLALCRDPSRAIIWFHGRDNPYGNPWENIKKAMENPNARDEIRTRIYGIALKRTGKRFSAFDPKVHVVG